MKHPLLSAAAACLALLAPCAQAANIVQTAQSTGMFGTLLSAAQAAGLAEALATKGPLTVFAPTDAAFAKLPKGTVESLLRPENKAQLAALLSYHVVPRAVMSDEVPTRRARVETLDPGATLTVVRKGTHVRVNGVRIIKADVQADNGVIHVIDSVLMPPPSGPLSRPRPTPTRSTR